MSKKSTKILIVDDSQLIVKLHAQLLRKLTDADLLMVCSGEDALAVVQEYPDLAVILLDMTMPGMDGNVFLEKLRGLGDPFDKIPVIVVTSADVEDRLIAAAKLGAQTLISKPLKMESLVPELQKLPALNLKTIGANEISKGRILLIEDSLLVREATTQVLKNAGYSVIASDDVWISNAIVTMRPDLILMDVGLGSPNSGFFAAKALKKTVAANIPIILYSARSAEELKNLQMQSGADGYVQKNAGPKALLDIVSGQIKQNTA